MQKFHETHSIPDGLKPEVFLPTHAMRLRAVAAICLLLAFTIKLNAATGKQQVTVSKDAEAIAVVQTALTAMSAKDGIGLQDSVASGTLTVTFGGNSVSMPIVLKSKGTQMVRTELQKPKGTSIRIVNQGVGVIEQPDGSVRWLLMNNTLAERASHIPVFSLLADFQDPTVSVENLGTAQVNGLSTIVVALRPLADPKISQAEWDRSLTKTTFYIDPASGTVVKIAYTNFAENDPNASEQLEVYLSDYKSFDGVLVPMRQTTYTDGKLESDLVLTSVTFNVGLPDSDFAIPDKKDQ